MDRLFDMYNNFMVWYQDLWINALGETGVEIVKVLMTCTVLMIVGFAFIDWRRKEINDEEYKSIVKK